MSDVFEKIKKSSISFRKEKSDMAPIATYLISEIQKENKSKSKDGVEPEISDDLVYKILKREIKKENGLISVIKDKPDTDDYVKKSEKVIDFYNSFLPTETTTEEIMAELISFAKVKDIKQMGNCMKHLKEKFGNSLNTVSASTIVRNYLKE